MPGATPPLVSVASRPDGVAVVTLRNPPVNALSSALQATLSTLLRRTLEDPAVRAVVLASETPRFFSGGADVSEFATITPSSTPFTPDATWCFSGAERGPKPLVAAVAGAALGGGLELALCCDERVATPAASFGLPETTLGIIPGLGGTQRLPRVVGFQKAMAMIVGAKPVGADEAKAIGLVDEVVDGGALVDVAARRALDRLRAGRRVTLARTDAIGGVRACRAIAAVMRKDVLPKVSKGGALPQYEAALRAALVGVERGGEAGLKAEGEEFAALVTSATSRGLVHMFFAQRETAKVALPGVEGYAGVAPRKVGVIGGGLMGAGIAAAMLSAGVDVVVKEVSGDFVDGARKRVVKNLGVRFADRAGGLVVTAEYAPLADVDMVVEAALEDPRVKLAIFKELEAACKPGCILATNTSTINVDMIGAGAPRAHAEGRVIGAHFFSPAHRMPLLEIVHTPRTSPRVVKDVLALAKKIRKTPVLVGNCAGFAVNRMYFPQGMVANYMVAELGLCPYRIDAACEKFGLPMGPFRLLDLVGLDIGIAVGGVFGMAFADRAYLPSPLPAMVAAGRKGQKTGVGFYKYDPKTRASVSDPQGVAPFLAQLRAQVGTAGAVPYTLSDGEIVEMILLSCVNEGCRILDEGVAIRSSDLDVCSVMGMAFPAWRGGLMKWAEVKFGGPAGVLRRLQHYAEMSSDSMSLFTPSRCLERLAAGGDSFQKPAPPVRSIGKSSDIVIVSAFRSAVGRAGRGGFKDTLPDEIMRPVFEKILSSVDVRPEDVGDVVMGTVLSRGDTGLAQTRVAGILSGLPVTVPVKTVNRLCSSGLQAIADAAAAIQAGHYKIAIAGGVESMSMASMVNKELKPNPTALKLKHKEAMSCYLAMGQTSENVAAKFDVSRESQDRMAVVSHARASAAKLADWQMSEIVPIETTFHVIDRETKKRTGTKKMVVERDEGVRVGVTLDALAKLPAVFKKGGSTTAGNSSQLSDGVAAVLMMSRSEAFARGCTPIAALRSFAVAGVDPAVMGIGPVEAIPLAIARAGLKVSDIDLFEINEAFGSQSDYTIRKLGLNRDIVNVNGGAIAIGHPLGMTGARLSVSILHELHRRGGRYGCVSMCIGTGMGAAAIYEINSDDYIPSAKL